MNKIYTDKQKQKFIKQYRALQKKMSPSAAALTVYIKFNGPSKPTLMRWDRS